ncbi:hypothetical protein HK097_007252 [Rhizophlyctis rosea]|uniref:Uncharacterized protein n=1 Tax=Rhizophlyctis rosea TaxID=64517 RepID=A0AAD5SEY6_9FUNG|nr:hypothetical protein HK097_007252 [Rhizophlyctis rosea]
MPKAAPVDPSLEVRKMLIGGLNWETTDESLRKYFEKFGDVEDCVVMKDSSTNRSRGFGFLTFRETRSVEEVLQLEHTLDGKIIDLGPNGPPLASEVQNMPPKQSAKATSVKATSVKASRAKAKPATTSVLGQLKLLDAQLNIPKPKFMENKGRGTSLKERTNRGIVQETLAERLAQLKQISAEQIAEVRKEIAGKGVGPGTIRYRQAVSTMYQAWVMTYKNLDEEDAWKYQPLKNDVCDFVVSMFLMRRKDGSRLYHRNTVARLADVFVGKNILGLILDEYDKRVRYEYVVKCTETIREYAVSYPDCAAKVLAKDPIMLLDHLALMVQFDRVICSNARKNAIGKMRSKLAQCMMFATGLRPSSIMMGRGYGNPNSPAIGGWKIQSIRFQLRRIPESKKIPKPIVENQNEADADLFISGEAEITFIKRRTLSDPGERRVSFDQGIEWSSGSVNAGLKKVAELAGYDPAHVTSKGNRSGLAQAIFQVGDKDTAQRMLLHKPGVPTTMESYIGYDLTGTNAAAIWYDCAEEIYQLEETRLWKSRLATGKLDVIKRLPVSFYRRNAEFAELDRKFQEARKQTLSYLKKLQEESSEALRQEATSKRQELEHLAHERKRLMRSLRTERRKQVAKEAMETARIESARPDGVAQPQIEALLDRRPLMSYLSELIPALERGRAGKQVYRCGDCGRMCDTSKQLYQHVNTHIKPYKCQDFSCELTFSRLANMREHYLAKHVAPEDREICTCECGRTFNQIQSLNRHTATCDGTVSMDEAGSKIWLCRRGCGKKYYSAAGERRHKDGCTYVPDGEGDMEEDDASSKPAPKPRVRSVTSKTTAAGINAYSRAVIQNSVVQIASSSAAVIDLVNEDNDVSEVGYFDDDDDDNLGDGVEVLVGSGELEDEEGEEYLVDDEEEEELTNFEDDEEVYGSDVDDDDYRYGDEDLGSDIWKEVRHTDFDGGYFMEDGFDD